MIINDPLFVAATSTFVVLMTLGISVLAWSRREDRKQDRGGS